jgi:pimeloyl-ACP methyl ester carboxylesterase
MLSGFGAAIASEPFDSMVDVGGYRLHMRVSAGCAVTIVFESGGTLDASQWSVIQPKIHDMTGAAVVSYDRTGFAQSDLPDGPYSLENEVVALHRALKKLAVPEKLILVGHSYGAFNVQLYAARYKDSIDGIVLLDPNTVAIVDAVGGVGQLTFNIGPELPPKIAQAKTRLRDALPETMEALRRAPLPQRIPLTVIAAGERWGPSDKFNDALRAGHKALVAGLPDHKLVIAEGSGHMINEDRSDLVLAAIGDMVSGARRVSPPHSCPDTR